jgi:very-short-patch-repair endonuclease
MRDSEKPEESGMKQQVDPSATARERQAPSIRLAPVTAPQVNFACQQNAVPVIREIEVENTGAEDLRDLVLEMRASPAFLDARRWRIDHLPAAGLLHVNDRETRLDGEYLQQLQESQQGELIFTLRDASGAVLAERHEPVEVLARNEWGGYGSSPELLAAFCMPNDRAVEQLLRNAAELLRRNGHDGTLYAYDRADAKRIWLQASAVWNALLALELDYALPPSSFERTGQKVRTPEAIVEARRATCLDTSLLLAALFEQIGLHPVIVLEDGHAYPGLWLRPDGFARAFTGDGQALRKRVQLKELLVMESTLLGQRQSFTAALRHAEDRLAGGEYFIEGVIDIARAREERIRPLSYVQRGADAAPASESAAGTVAFQALDALPEDADELGGRTVEWTHEASGPGGRLGQWQRRLLDLSLRNPLLNMRSSRTNIPLLVPDPALLEDLLAQGKAIAIEAAPDHGARDGELHARQTGEKLDDEVALAAIRRGRVYAQLDAQKLESALIELYRRARNDLEEGGSNTLFLAIGTLCWQRPGAGERVYRAPLVLLPVTITRQSVRSGIRLTLSDDEPRFNTTLLELLRQDFSLDIQGLDGALPQDENGTDVQAILTRVRQEVRDVAGFEVRDEVRVGTFSFAKYLMWKDLVDRTEKLKDNAVVRHLMETPREPFGEGGYFIDPATLDQRIDPADQFTPLHADSSQLAAVMAAAAGRNFVMIGPPGTGKSQTIANMIAHNLGLGRTVLFVSEKAAALNVVYRRLREQGLGEFCLELHSNKARKLDAIKQLGEAWEARGKLTEGRWREQTNRLRDARNELNLFVSALHEHHRNGLSLRDALALAAGHAGTPAVELSWPDPQQHTPEEYQRLLAIGERIDLNAAEIGDPQRHPLRLLHVAEWSVSWQQAVLAGATELSARAQAWLLGIGQLAQRLELAVDVRGPERLHTLSTLAAALRESAGHDLSFAFAPDAIAAVEAGERASALLEEFGRETARLSCRYDRERLLRADLAGIGERWRQAGQAWWLPRLLGVFACRGRLRKEAGAQGKPDIAADLPILLRLQEIDRELRAFAPALEKIGGWSGLDSDLPRLRQLSGLGQRLRTASAGLADDAEALARLRASLRTLVVDGNELLTATAPLGAQLAEFQRLNGEFDGALQRFAELAGQDAAALLDQSGGLQYLATLSEQLHGAQNRLNAWCAWRRVRQEAVAVGLLPVVEAIESGRITAGGARQAIAVNHARWWVARIVDATPVLRRFVPVEHERRIADFRELDAKVRGITADYVRTRIRSGLIDREEVKRSSEFGIIRRELEKKTRHKPLRQLISEAPNAIPKLTPCLLMSPLSIAQYLPVEQPPFDLVVFDEASQITVWDAIGAIARGRQTVVVGDPRQLPPTSFFSSEQSVDEEGEEEEDLESILDELLGANLPTINLSWHYRSRHESLITFSNHRYYKGGLITFPSPVTRDTAVSMTFIGGLYDRGGSQTNRAEAEAVVEEIRRRLLDPVASKQTVGVVTFNQKQQTLILDLLDAMRRDNPDLDRFFAEDLIEPVFVKNLESVQGDERDVILFSTTFGPDQSGRVSMNFGPLNKNGGERRLNVAITRARVELKVFSSLRAEQIDLSRTAALGVRDLKHFLEFAEQGVRALGEAGAVASRGEFASPLEAALAGDLRTRGWTLQPQVGVSSFRIDLGVVDPDEPERYLAGIECDGATYERAASARDRDLVRESVLRGLGWEILRLWSTEFWLDPAGVTARIDQQLKALHERSRARRRKEKETAAAPGE